MELRVFWTMSITKQMFYMEVFSKSVFACVRVLSAQVDLGTIPLTDRPCLKNLVQLLIITWPHCGVYQEFKK